MKSILLVVAMFSVVAVNAQGGQNKAARPSPPDSLSVTLKNGALLNINYSQPSVKGRTIGKDLEPMEGKVWRTGANEATVFEITKDVKVEGKDLPAGKYGLFTEVNGDTWTIIFNKTWNQWGAFNYKEADDILRVNVKSKKSKNFTEKFKITAEKDGDVNLLWGDYDVEFKVK